MIYDVNGTAISNIYDYQGNLLSAAYDIDGNIASGDVSPYVYGTSYAFSAMTYTDTSSVTETSTSHKKNSTTTIKYTPTVSGDATTAVGSYEWVNFTCNISTNGQPLGVWVYTAPECVPTYGGKTSIHDGLIRLRIKLNTTTYTWVDVHAGMECYLIQSPPSTVTAIGIACINNKNCTNLSELYLDSVEVGFHPRRAHVMFNLDCVPSNFIDVGYPLFQQYGLKCTLQYLISSTSSTPGADSDYLDVQLHNQLMSEGYDYCTYSGWKKYEYSEVTPYYDDPTKQATFEAHAERLWKVNNNSGIYAPSTINGTGFLWGYVYNNACRDYDFLMIRRGNAASIDNNQSLLTYYDPDVRTMIPYFIQNQWTASSTNVTRIKSRIDHIVASKQAIQIGFHEIKDSSYTPGSNDIYIGAAAVEEILSYVKFHVDAGNLVCCTTADYVKEMAPEAYAEWYAQRHPQL